MNRITKALLIPVLLLVACGGAQLLPDIDATVYTKIELAKSSLIDLDDVPDNFPTTVVPPRPTPDVVWIELPL